MATDSFGGIAVEDAGQATDAFGGIAVDTPPRTDAFGGIPLEPTGETDTLKDDLTGLWADMQRSGRQTAQAFEMAGLMSQGDPANQIDRAEALASRTSRIDPRDTAAAQARLAEFDAQAAQVRRPASPYQQQLQQAELQRQRQSLEGQLAEVTPAAGIATPEEIQTRQEDALRRMANREVEIRELGQESSPEIKRWEQAHGWDAVAAFAQDPFEITSNIILTSLIGSSPALVGGMAGSALGPAGTAAGAGLGSFAVEYSNGVLDALREAGVDLTQPKAVASALQAPGLLADARRYAAQRGVPVAVFDAATAGLAGRILQPALGTGLRNVIKATGQEIGVQALGGAGGEAAAQVASGRPGDVKSMFMEAVGELAPTETLLNVRGELQRQAAARPDRTDAFGGIPVESEADLSTVAVPGAEAPPAADPLAAPPPAPVPASAPPAAPPTRWELHGELYARLGYPVPVLDAMSLEEMQAALQSGQKYQRPAPAAPAPAPAVAQETGSQGQSLPPDLSPEERAEARRLEDEARREMEEDLRNLDQANAGTKLSDALRHIGYLPAPDSAAGADFAGELRRLQEFHQARRTSKNGRAKADLPDFFKGTKSLDHIAELLREQGFATSGPDDVLDLVEGYLANGTDPVGFEGAGEIEPSNVPFSQQPKTKTSAGTESLTAGEARRLRGIMRDQWRALGERQGAAVVVVNDVAELPAQLAGETARAAVQSGAIVEAFFITTERPDGTRSRRIVIVRNGAAQVAAERGISLDKRVRQLALHEIVHHYGSLGALLPKAEQRRYNDVVDGLIKRLQREDPELLAYLTRPKAEGGYGYQLQDRAARASIVEEYLARTHERATTPPGWWQKAVAAIKEILRRAFPQLAWTDNDVRTLLDLARHKAEKLSDPAPVLKMSQQPARPTSEIRTPEREAMREQIRQQILTANPALPADTRPILYVLAGGMAAGKNRLGSDLKHRGVIQTGHLVEIDADAIKEQHLPEYAALVNAGDRRAGAVTHRESSDLAWGILDRALALPPGQQRNIVMNAQFVSPDTDVPLIERARAAGFEVRLIGVTIDPTVAANRSEERFLKDGRWIDPAAVLASHPAFARAFRRLQAVADRVLLFDNTASQKATLIASGAGGRLAILDQSAYGAFEKRSHETTRTETATLHRPANGDRPAVGDRGTRPGDQGPAGEVGRGSEGASGQGPQVAFSAQPAGPEIKQRRYTARVEGDETIAPEIRAQVPSYYVAETTREWQDYANDLINRQGLDAAMNAVLQTGRGEGKTAPTGRTNALGLELVTRLQDAGRHEDAVTIIRHVAEGNTTQAQAIRAMGLYGRLDATGAQLYGEKLVSEAAAATAAGDPQVTDLLKQIERLRDDLAKARHKHATDAILDVQQILKEAGWPPEKMTEVQQKMRALLLQSVAEPGIAADRLRGLLIATGMERKKAEALTNKALRQFRKRLGAARNAMLRQLLKVPPDKIRVPRSQIEKWIALNDAGRLDDETIYGTIARKFGLPIFTRDMAAAIKRAQAAYQAAPEGDLKLAAGARMMDEIHSLVPADWATRLRTVRNMAMLLNPKTILRNVGGNQVLMITDAAADTLNGWTIDPLVSLFTGRRARTTGAVIERAKGLAQPWHDFWTGVERGRQLGHTGKWRLFTDGLEHFRSMAKITNASAWDVRHFRATFRHVFTGRTMRFLEDTLTIALGGGDRVFHTSAYQASLRNQMQTAARNGTPVLAPTPEMAEQALLDANRAILQDENVMSSTLLKLQRALNVVGIGKPTDPKTGATKWGEPGRFGFGNVLLPFAQIPGGAIMRGAEFSPLGFIRSAYELLAPHLGRTRRFDQKAFGESLSRALVGTGGYALGAWLLKLGVLSALPDDDKDLEAMRKAAGLGGLRMNVSELKRRLLAMNFAPAGSMFDAAQDGDLVVTYDWLQPASFTVAAGAQTQIEMAKHEHDLAQGKIPHTTTAMVAGLIGATRGFEHMSVLNGLKRFTQTTGTRESIGEAMVQTMVEAPASFVPTVANDLNKLLDNTLREMRTDATRHPVDAALAAVLQRIPGATAQFPPRFDAFGQAMARYQYGGNTLLNVMANPSFMTHVRKTPELRELERIYASTLDADATPPTRSRLITVNGRMVELTNEQLAQYKYLTGRAAQIRLTQLMAAPAWARLPDTLKARYVGGAFSDAASAGKILLFGDRPKQPERGDIMAAIVAKRAGLTQPFPRSANGGAAP